MRSNTHNLVQCQSVKISTGITTLKALSMILDSIDQKTTGTNEQQINSLLKCAVKSMENSQESLVVAW